MAEYKLDSTKKIVVTICLSVAAICFICVGTFIDGWWESYFYSVINNKYTRTVIRYSLWEIVECNGGICRRGGTDSTGWIVFTRLMGISGLILCCMSFIVQIIYLWKKRPVLKYIAICCSGVNGAVMFLTSLIITGELFKITKSVQNQLTTTGSSGILRYGTLPLGMFYLCSFTCSVTTIFLVVDLSRGKKTVAV